MTKVIAITQARSGSTRLPAKVLKTILGKTMLEYHLDRLKNAKRLDAVVVATTLEDNDIRIVEIADKVGLPHYRGSVNDVLDRYYGAAKPFAPNYVVRVTSDCPLIDPKLIDEVVEFTINGDYDYVCNVIEQSGYPDGEDVEVFKFSALEKAWNKAELKSEREHVTPYIRNNSSYFGKQPFKSSGYDCTEGDFTNIRLTVDEQQDFEVIKHLIETLGVEKSWIEYTQYYIDNKLNELNGAFERAEGYKKSLMND